MANPKKTEPILPVAFSVMTDEFRIKVAGEEIEGDVKGSTKIKNISSEMDSVAYQMSYWGGVLASAKAEHEQLDALYRQFRAVKILASLKLDSKMAEWKCKAEIEASRGFMRHKNAKCLSVRNISQIEALIGGLEKKADMLRSKGANMRFEIGAQSMTTPSDPKTSDSGSSSRTKRDARTKRVREAIAKKRKT